jgi:hypothetical protein
MTLARHPRARTLCGAPELVKHRSPPRASQTPCATEQRRETDPTPDDRSARGPGTHPRTWPHRAPVRDSPRSRGRMHAARRDAPSQRVPDSHMPVRVRVSPSQPVSASMPRPGTSSGPVRVRVSPSQRRRGLQPRGRSHVDEDRRPVRGLRSAASRPPSPRSPAALRPAWKTISRALAARARSCAAS